MMEIAIAVGLPIFGAIFTVLWYLLRQKDAAQEEAIKKLFQLHDSNAIGLSDLRLQIAQGHYNKDELNVKFDKLDNSFKDGFKQLGDKLEEFNRTLIQYIHGKGQ